jgi:hypothetical protein
VNRWRAEDSWQWVLYGDRRAPLFGAQVAAVTNNTTTVRRIRSVPVPVATMIPGPGRWSTKPPLVFVAIGSVLWRQKQIRVDFGGGRF